MIIPITRRLWRNIEDLARKRHIPKERLGIKGKWNGSSLKTHQMGLLGEVAVAKALGLKVDRRVWLHGDGGEDLRLPDGRTVQVKYRGEKGWDYGLSGTDPGELADVNVLVWPSDEGWPPGAVEIVGYLTREQFLDVAYEWDRGYGMRLWACYVEFHPLEELLEVEGEPA